MIFQNPSSSQQMAAHTSVVLCLVVTHLKLLNKDQHMLAASEKGTSCLGLRSHVGLVEGGSQECLAPVFVTSFNKEPTVRDLTLCWP